MDFAKVIEQVCGRLDAAGIRYALIEDLVGLKIQALVNDPLRAIADWDDIRLLLQTAGQQGWALDWNLLSDYLQLFRMEHRLGELKAIYGTAE